MTIPDDNTNLQANLGAAAHAHWKALLTEGVILAVLGLFAVAFSSFASVFVTIALGWLFLISGVAGLIMTFWARQQPGFWWSLVSAVVALIAGVVLLARPLEATLTLTIVVGAYFLAEGVVTIMYALEHRRELTERWGWLLAAGLADLLVAAVIISGLPGTALWAIGLLVGINLLFGGASLIAMALAARNSR